MDLGDRGYSLQPRCCVHRLGLGTMTRLRNGRYGARIQTGARGPVPFVYVVGWVPGAVWTGAGNLPLPQPGCDPWTIQPVARHADCAVPTHLIVSINLIN